MIRFLDFVFAVMGIIILLPIFILIWIIGLFENGSPIFTQTRIGYLQKNFTLIKFRTMKKDTISVATHLVKDPVITRYGIFLRKTKFDEIPQLWKFIALVT